MRLMAWWLFVGHFVGDYVWQGDTMAVNKNPDAGTSLQKNVPWFYWMLAHSLVHGAIVTAITGYESLGAAEVFCHFAIDFGKCKKLYGIHNDQVLHMTCKVVWLALATRLI